MKTLVCPVDFSATTAAVVDLAGRISQAFGARLCILHVAAPDPEFVGYEAGPQVVRDAVARKFRREHQQLEEIEADLRSRNVDVEALLIQGPTVEKILTETARLGGEMIVIGSHGHSALHDLLVGSVTVGVLRGAKCPVLVVPAQRSA